MLTLCAGLKTLCAGWRRIRRLGRRHSEKTEWNEGGPKEQSCSGTPGGRAPRQEGGVSSPSEVDTSSWLHSPYLLKMTLHFVSLVCRRKRPNSFPWRFFKSSFHCLKHDICMAGSLTYSVL